MEILANLKELKFKVTLPTKLPECSINEFEAGKMARTGCYVLTYKNNSFGVSQWVSPKRTRSYPYARVYDTMSKQLRVTIIPVVKDEGFDGDRDFVQWDTVSLMSLLNVFVILGYYQTAEKNPNYENKITNQILDYKYLREQLDSLVDYKSSALHWNLSQLENSLQIIKKCKSSYKNISKTLNIKMHSFEGIDKRIEFLKDNARAFKEYSRSLAASAQDRELQTTQPKESVIEEKAKITIWNYLGGLYYLTVDEAVIKKGRLFLIEKKHSKNTLFPSMNDIKDGIIKMILFSNLAETKIGSKSFNHLSVLGLTSSTFMGCCHNYMTTKNISNCLEENDFSSKQKKTIFSVFNEGKQNNFFVFLMDSNRPEYQSKILNYTFFNL